jgi:dihydropyrimidinase
VSGPDRCLRGALLPDRPEEGARDVLITGGKIADVAAAGTIEAAQTVDLSGAWLLPGVVDAHVHPIHAETFASVGEESVRGGITTVLNHLYPEPGEPVDSAVRRAAGEARQSAADFGFHVRITPDRLADGPPGPLPGLDRVAQIDGVLAVKVFLAHGNPDVACRPEQLVFVAAAARDAGLPVIVHAEFGQVISALESVLGQARDLRSHDLLRSAHLEAAAVATVAAIAQRLNARVYIAHLSSPEAVRSMLQAREAGTRILGETCPHYLALDTDHQPDSNGRVTPPLRSPDARREMRSLVAGGALDVLASDHCGYDAHDKPQDDFTAADNGLPGLDTMLNLMLDAVLAEGGWLTARQLVELLCTGPARAFGVSGKGTLSPGTDADLVVVDPAGSTVASAYPSAIATAPSPYAGRQLRGRVVDVLRRGEYAVRNGRPTGLTAGTSVLREELAW